MRSVLIPWFLLLCLLLQSVAWALPDQRDAQAARLTHALAHAIEHGHPAHAPDVWGHDVDPDLQGDEAPGHGGHGPHHTHAADAGQVQGLPVPTSLTPLLLPCAPPGACALVQPLSADPRLLLRPPRHAA